MKVLYFHQHFSTPAGASGIRSYQMARELVRLNHSVTMVCGSNATGKTGLNSKFKRGRREGTVDGIRVIEFDISYSNKAGFIKRTWLFAEFAARSIGVALREPCDLVFATTTPLTAAIPGICARWLRRKLFVFEVRDLWPELPKAMGVIKNPIILGLLSLLEWVAYRSADRCIALSPGIVDGIAKRGVSRDKIAMIPNGCDLAIFNSGDNEAWRPLDVSNQDFMAVYTGTHGQANGLDALLDAALVLKARNIASIKIVLVGDGKLKPKLVERAYNESLDNVVFLNGVSKQKIAALMKSADAGLQCLANVPAFYYGTSPNKFFDYLAAGLPVIINYPGWLAEMIVAHDCGSVSPPDNPALLADALVSASAQKVKWRECGKNARQLAEQKFDRNELSKRFENWLSTTSRS